MYVCIIAYDGSAARSSHQPEEDTASGGEMGLLSASSGCKANGQLATQTAVNDVAALLGRLTSRYGDDAV